MLKRVAKIAGILLLVALLVAGGYAAYVFISYHRLPDEDITPPVSADAGQSAGETAALKLGEPCDIVTWNLGFGAYSADFSFFMDGGTESRAFSREAVLANIAHAIDVLDGLDARFTLLQEVDIGSTRSYQVNEAQMLAEALGGYKYFAQDYDSPYLFYPLTSPHGASRSGLLTLSNTRIARCARRSLPVEKGFRKLLDLDRCYSKVFIPVEDGKSLVLYNLHLSAYSSDGRITDDQLDLLTADMLAEYRSGNYVVAGGDFNKDLPGNSAEVFGVAGDGYTWAQPLKQGAICEGLALVNPLDAEHPVPSCRNCDTAYIPGKTFVLIVDGFIVSDNVRVLEARVVDEGFAASDHNPVMMTFIL